MLGDLTNGQLTKQDIDSLEKEHGKMLCSDVQSSLSDFIPNSEDRLKKFEDWLVKKKELGGYTPEQQLYIFKQCANLLLTQGISRDEIAFDTYDSTDGHKNYCMTVGGSTMIYLTNYKCFLTYTKRIELAYHKIGRSMDPVDFPPELFWSVDLGEENMFWESFNAAAIYSIQMDIGIDPTEKRSEKETMDVINKLLDEGRMETLAMYQKMGIL